MKIAILELKENNARALDLTLKIYFCNEMLKIEESDATRKELCDARTELTRSEEERILLMTKI